MTGGLAFFLGQRLSDAVLLRVQQSMHPSLVAPSSGMEATVSQLVMTVSTPIRAVTLCVGCPAFVVGARGTGLQSSVL